MIEIDVGRERRTGEVKAGTGVQAERPLLDIGATDDRPLDRAEVDVADTVTVEPRVGADPLHIEGARGVADVAADLIAMAANRIAIVGSPDLVGDPGEAQPDNRCFAKRSIDPDLGGPLVGLIVTSFNRAVLLDLGIVDLAPQANARRAAIEDRTRRSIERAIGNPIEHVVITHTQHVVGVEIGSQRSSSELVQRIGILRRCKLEQLRREHRRRSRQRRRVEALYSIADTAFVLRQPGDCAERHSGQAEIDVVLAVIDACQVEQRRIDHGSVQRAGRECPGPRICIDDIVIEGVGIESVGGRDPRIERARERGRIGEDLRVGAERLGSASGVRMKLEGELARRRHRERVDEDVGRPVVHRGIRSRGVVAQVERTTIEDVERPLATAAARTVEQ